LVLLDSTFDKPNGICFSPDEKKLYVNESARCLIYVWDVIATLLINKKLFYTIPAAGYADGMKVDPAGNLLLHRSNGSVDHLADRSISGQGCYDRKSLNCAWGIMTRENALHDCWKFVV